MARIHVIRQVVLERLKEEVSDPARRELYRTAKVFPLPGDATLPGGIELPGEAPALEIDERNPASTDAENSILIYEWLRSLDEVQASDERLWAWLTHVPFFTYSQKRWDTTENTENPEKTIRAFHEHFFLRGGLAALRRNSISRLWWAARLTYAPWLREAALGGLKQEDPYCHTRVLFSNQDIYQGLIERSFGTNYAVLMTSLEIFRREPGRQTSDFAKRFLKELNLTSCYRELSVLSADRLLSELEAMAKRVQQTST